MITRVYQIADRVCNSMGIDPEDLRGPSRSKRLLLARRIIAYQAKMHGFSFPDIAQIVRGSRSKHATIIAQFEYAERGATVRPDFDTASFKAFTHPHPMRSVRRADPAPTIRRNHRSLKAHRIGAGTPIHSRSHHWTTFSASGCLPSGQARESAGSPSMVQVVKFSSRGQVAHIAAAA